MNRYIWLDGVMLPIKKALIPITTHTLHYGSGVFEGIRCYVSKSGPAIFRLSEHIERLLTSFSQFSVVSPWTKKELEQAVIDTVRMNGLKSCYIRPILFFGSESLFLSPTNISIHCAVIVFDMKKYLGSKPVNVGISKIKRVSPDAVPVHSKINGLYVNSIFALNEVKKRGFDEALLLDKRGTVAEGSVANVFFVIHGIVVTPKSTYILPGITRKTIITLIKRMQIPFEERVVTVQDIQSATEAFFTGTASEITSIACIEDFTLPQSPGPITKKMKDAYNKVISGDNKKWLTFI